MKLIFFKIMLLVLLSMTYSCASMLKLSDQSSSNSFSEQSSTAQVTAKVTNSKEANIAFNKALAAIKINDSSAAENAFKTMLLEGVKSPTALNHYAIFLREQWRMEEAEDIYLRALKYSPNNAMTHWNLAIFYELYRGDYKQALVHYQAYQQFAESPDKRVVYWISDLTRRLEKESS